MTKYKERPAPGMDTSIVGRVEYKGRPYYAAWIGTTQYGEKKARLVFRDGSQDFWVDLSKCKILKRYSDHPRFGYPTLRSMKKFIDARKRGECPKCKDMFALGYWGPYNGSGDYDNCPLCGQVHEELG